MIEVFIPPYLCSRRLAPISKEVGRSAAAVGGLLRRGMKKLREILGENQQVDDAG